MRETQIVALGLFEEHGFAAVSVEDVARAMEMSPSTVYRHFGTKEALVLWDEHDAAITAALERRLGTQPPLAAIRDSFVEGLAETDPDDQAALLRRVRFIFTTPAIHAAATAQDTRDRASLAEGLRAVLPGELDVLLQAMAGGALLALDLALEEWQRSGTSDGLAGHIHAAFAALGRIGEHD